MLLKPWLAGVALSATLLTTITGSLSAQAPAGLWRPGNYQIGEQPQAEQSVYPQLGGLLAAHVAPEPVVVPVSQETSHEFAGPQTYEEVLLNPQPVQGQYAPQSYVQPKSQFEYVLRGHTGMSYFSSSPENHSGGYWAVDGAIPLYRALALFARVSGDHFEDNGETNSAYLTTVGLLKVAVPTGNHGGARFGYGVLYDYYTDDRQHGFFDVPSDYSFSQLRFNVNYLVTPNDTLGVTWNNPLDEGDRDLQGLFSFPVNVANTAEVYASHANEYGVVTASLGYRDDILFIGETRSYGLRTTTHLTEQIDLVASYNYEDTDVGHRHVGFLGFQFSFGPGAGSIPAYASTGRGYRSALALAGANQDVVRGDTMDPEASSESSSGSSAPAAASNPITDLLVGAAPTVSVTPNTDGSYNQTITSYTNSSGVAIPVTTVLKGYLDANGTFVAGQPQQANATTNSGID